ncbi:MAG: hypothetical protein Q8L13_06820 [Bradyrhizobium sp.]|uniref:hypothetical protein n=1 Tax=Bradyrhizobium sp. TaxID=376 RepID=UPI002731BA48|nr:hypothetical protein [Bradyrhizobium sp.]MDP1866043.1 hypothetical protein [Bradyrhizobium sp.]
MPPDFEPNASKGLGMRLVSAFTSQLGGRLDIRRHDPGAEFILTFPRLDGRNSPGSGAV